MSKSLIHVKNVSFIPEDASGKRILYDINIDIKKGKITTLIGPNGAGKTTLLKIILGLISPTTGTIMRQKNLKIGYVPQKIQFNSFLPLRVMDFLMLFTHDHALIQEKLAFFKLEDRKKTQMHHLSGGELQKILLSQATLRGPNLLILDEPSQGVDIITQNELYTYIDQMRDTIGCAVLLVSHDLHMVMAKSDAVLCLNHHICCHGHPEDVKKHPEYIGLFGGHLPENLAPYHHHHDHMHEK
ncbi:MAG: metal ABC transporter ATP-binding protein [Alphaproteobacteria bacterium]|nr:metal ABC transporter ATP-binding protein [Alphaproteobacteria bacterium]